MSIAEKIDDNLVKSKFNYSKYLINQNNTSFLLKKKQTLRKFSAK